jgi:hypothetical protein
VARLVLLPVGELAGFRTVSRHLAGTPVHLPERLRFIAVEACRVEVPANPRLFYHPDHLVEREHLQRMTHRVRTSYG